ncbi:uncharacterized protein [Diabrotica undecimpunctata]|uniref:uncharacterized protein n=1 Tax=Diabrotica undecimpunctata TaxID=50387 RepID=UPI003B6397C9
MKRCRQSSLIEKSEVVIWRRNYIKKIRQYRTEKRKIYYLDETWLNEGHTVNKVWHDLNITSSRQAFVDGLSTGLKAPSGKGRRLIITHIGSESGFLPGGLLCFESKKSGDCHEDMDAQRFETWFSSILPTIEPGSVIILDNAPYHSRQVEKLPTTSWRKRQIIDWLDMKLIAYDRSMIKPELLNIARQHKHKYHKYVVDEMALSHGVLVHRLPPYHCELNPIELIWAQVKTEVARRNTTFKLCDVKVLFDEAIRNVTVDNWRKCIGHVEKIENKMWDVDIQVDVIMEPIIVQLDDESDDSDNSDFE